MAEGGIVLQRCAGGELSESEEGRDIALVIGERGAGVRGEQGDCMQGDCMQGACMRGDCMRGDERTDCRADADGDTCVRQLLCVCRGVKTEAVVWDSLTAGESNSTREFACQIGV